MVENCNYADKNLLVIGRLVIHSICQKFCKKTLKAQDIFSLPFDDELEKTINTDENERQLRIAAQLENMLNNKG